MPDQTWRPLREPSPWLMQLFAIPLGIGSFAGIGWFWLHATPLKPDDLATPEFVTLGLISFIPLIVVHELIHAAMHPGFGSSNATIVGLWPSRLLLYAHYDGELTRNRFAAILAMPSIFITLLPLAAALISNTAQALVAWVSTWNALFACGDLFGILLILFQVPSRAICRNQGWRTYWKPSTIQN
jgi:hypothetical protein